jgi:hypothetical protein
MTESSTSSYFREPMLSRQLFRFFRQWKRRFHRRTECLESSNVDDEVLCGLDPDLRERNLRSVVDQVFTRQDSIGANRLGQWWGEGEGMSC